MTKRIAVGVACLLLTTCTTIGKHLGCPTLWIQVTKSEPAPWPEIPPVEAAPLQVPAVMQNRFDVIAKHPGARTIFAPAFTDRVDPRDHLLTARTHALEDYERILAAYHDTGLSKCAATVKATVMCDVPGGSGIESNCNALVVEQVGTPVAVFAKGSYRLVRRIGNPTHDVPHPRIFLTEALDAADNEELSDVCLIDDLTLATTMLSFVHLSDIQLRDPSVVLTDRRLSKRLDWFTPLSSFEYDEDLAFYNQYVVEAIFATINATVTQLPESERPKFVIHTGDSVDSNMKSELVRLHKMIDRLSIPFFNVLGNHDVLAFGNLVPTDTHDSDDTCTPVASLIGHETSLAPDKICVDRRVKRCPTCSGDDSTLIATTTQADTRRRFMDVLAHKQPDHLAQVTMGEADLYCEDTVPKVRNDAYTRAHGFDLGTKNGHLDGERLGYYAFVQKLAGPAGRHAVFIVLDGEDLEDGHGGIYGRIGHEQLDWLRKVLACVAANKAGDLVFVLAHQPLSMIAVPADDVPKPPKGETTRTVLAHLLESSPNVVGYLYGHHHEHAICGDHRDGVCSHFWEIETGSLVEFPQEGRLIRIKQLGQQLAYLEVSAFTEQLVAHDTDVARYVDLARRGAERDHCVTHDARCSEDHRPYRTDGYHTAGRLFFKLPPVTP